MYLRKEDTPKSLSNLKLSKSFIPKEISSSIKEFYSIKCPKEMKKALYTILKSLNMFFGIVNCGLKLIHEPRPLIKDKKGNYWLKGEYIEYKRGIPVISIWTFSETSRKISNKNIFQIFIHEYIHHYDMKKLKIYVDHDKGFHSRLNHLKGMI